MTECPKPDKPNLKVMYEESLLSARNLLVSRQNEFTLMNYAIGLENTVLCYESQVLFRRKSENITNTLTKD